MLFIKQQIRRAFNILGFDIHKLNKKSASSESSEYASTFDLIFNHSSLINKPLVLLDVGASGGIQSEWLPITKYATWIGFDADNRELDSTVSQSKNCKKQILINCLVSDRNIPDADFYLTSSPFCSSMLHPNNEELSAWNYADLFQVERTIKLPCRSISEVLASNGIDHVDWLKVDSQGIDLRITKSLPPTILDNIISLDYEPGIVNAYKGEDFFLDVVQFMRERPYWITKMTVKGAEKVDINELKSYFSDEELQQFRFGNSFLKSAPGWVELGYLRNFDEHLSIREVLVLIAFSLISDQEGNALKVSNLAAKKFGDPVFNEIGKNIIKKWKINIQNRMEIH